VSVTPGAPAGVVGQVLKNCNRSDAQVAGRFSLCGLLLRLRNLYKWEKGLPPWHEEDSGVMLEWVSRREEYWETLLDAPLDPLQINGRELDPFEAEEINRLLAPKGLYYGAGLAGGMTPVFFLASQVDEELVEGLVVRTLRRELVSDILFLPGLRRGGQVHLRPTPLAYLLWDKIADPTPSLSVFCRFALQSQGLDRARVLARPDWETLGALVDGELKSVLWHELGEALVGRAAEDLLLRMAGEHPASELEFFTRGLKDMMADCGPKGRLARIISHRATACLGFYPAWLGGFPKLLFPEIGRAVTGFAEHGDWAAVEAARLAGWQRASDALGQLSAMADELSGAALASVARQALIAPLTNACARK